MKKYYISLCLCVSSLGLLGQGYYLIPAINAGTNPGGLNMDPEQPEAFLTGNNLGYTSVLSSSTADAWSPAQTIPFSFNFNGAAETQYYVASSGVVTFGATTPSTTPGFTPALLPAAGIPSKSVCAWGMDLTGANDAVVSKTFGASPNRQHWVIWASASNSALGAGWAYWGIVMEETSNRIYVVDMRSFSQGGANVALSVGIQVDGSTAYSVTGSPAVTSNNTATGGNQSDALDNTYYEFAYGTQPQYDIALISVSASDIAGLTTAENFEALVQNKGSETITSFNYNYNDNQGGNGTTGITQSLGTGDFATISMSPGWTAPSAGSYTVDLDITDPNNNTDANPGDNTKTFSIQAAQDVPRTFLAEEFSSATCPPCKTWNDNVYNAALATYNQPGNPLVIKYQVPIPSAGDPSLNPDSEGRRQYYGINSAPTMLGNGGEVDYGSVQTWGDALTAYQAAEAAGGAAPAFVSVTGTATYDRAAGASTADVDVSASVTSNLDLTTGNYALQMVVLSNNYVYNAAPNGDFNYKHVMRKMLPGINGTALNLAAGASGNYTESYNFTVGNVSGGATSGNYNLWNNDVEVIVFVEDRDNNRIMNAALAATTYVGLEDEDLVKATIYPNPADNALNITLDGEQELSVSIIDLTGKTVMSQDFGLTTGETLNTSNLNAGMYIVQIVADGKMAAQRIAVTH
jgi:hypothetical protein